MSGQISMINGFHGGVLPRDLHLSILEFLSLKDLWIVSMVNRTLHSLCNDDRIWRRLSLHKWKKIPIQIPYRWKEFYYHLHQFTKQNPLHVRPIVQDHLLAARPLSECVALNVNFLFINTSANAPSNLSHCLSEPNAPLTSLFLQKPPPDSQKTTLTLFTAHADSSLKIWSIDPRQKTINLILSSHIQEGPITAIEMYTNTLICGSITGQITFWDLHSKKPLQILNRLTHKKKITYLKHTLTSKNDQIIFCGYSDGTVLRFLKGYGFFEFLESLNGHRDEITGIAYEETTGKVITGSLDKTIKIWEQNIRQQFNCIQTLNLNEGVSCIYKVWSRGRMFSASTNGDIHIWKHIKGKWYREILLNGNGHRITSIQLNLEDNHKIFTVSANNLIRIWKYSVYDERWEDSCKSAKEIHPK